MCLEDDRRELVVEILRHTDLGIFCRDRIVRRVAQVHTKGSRWSDLGEQHLAILCFKMSTEHSF
jgi:hypothetical protein